MLAMFNNQPIFGPRGPAGPDGNPIGTIINYMGVSAPTDYLICDGTVYNVSDYSKLAEFFKTQFGSSNYFGGDGTTTFAVPDMRNLFLRGFHGTSEEQLSGEVGVRQQATQIPYIQLNSPNVNNVDILAPTGVGSFVGAKETDNDSGALYHNNFFRSTNIATGSGYETPAIYTSRPVNMAILYCIKATVAKSYEDIYSIEETRIGTWIDGKPIYRRIAKLVMPDSVNYQNYDIGISDFGELIFLQGIVRYLGSEGQNSVVLNYGSSAGNSDIGIWDSGVIWISTSISGMRNKPVTVIVEYTKTTD